MKEKVNDKMEDKLPAYRRFQDWQRGQVSEKRKIRDEHALHMTKQALNALNLGKPVPPAAIHSIRSDCGVLSFLFCYTEDLGTQWASFIKQANLHRGPKDRKLTEDMEFQ